jgi:uncharacterized protein
MTATAREATAQRDRRPLVGQPEIVCLLVLAALLSQRWLVDLLDVPALRTWTTMFLAIVIQALPFLVMGVLLASAISTFLSEALLRKALPQRPALAVPVAGVAGVALPGCECASVPIASSLIRRGVAPAAAFSFLLAAPAVNPVVLVSTAVAFPGRPDMVGARFAASLVVALAVGWIWAARGGRVPLRLPGRSPHGTDRSFRTFLATAQHDLMHTAGFLVAGAMIAAAVNTFVPRAWIDIVADNLLLSILVMALFAFVVALCSEADAFVAASLTSFSDTAKLTFMVVGPAVDVKLAALQSGHFGRQFAARFVPLTLAVAIASSTVVGVILL